MSLKASSGANYIGCNASSFATAGLSCEKQATFNCTSFMQNEDRSFWIRTLHIIGLN